MDIGTLLDFTGIRYLWSKISPYIADEYASKADVESIASAVGSGLAFKGAVADVADLPASGNETGDMYSVTAAAPDGGNYAWDGTAWVKLAETVDTSMFALDADVVHLAGAETIGGTKTFSDPIIGDLDGTAEQALKDGAGNVIASTYATTAVATDQVSGLMSAADKAKLDGIANYANAYSLPQAGYGSLGGVQTISTVTTTDRLTPCPIISGVVYYDADPEPAAIADAYIDGLFA